MSNHLHTDLPPLTLSFMGANFVARELGYGAADEWGPFDAATNAAFEPLETYRRAPRRDPRGRRLGRVRGDGHVARRT